jgi:hypothetical protein
VQDKHLSGRLLEGFVFTSIFKTFRFAIQPGKMAIGLLAVVALVLAGYAMDLRPTIVVTPGVTIEDISAVPETGLLGSRPATELHASLTGHEAWTEYTSFSDTGARIGVFRAMWEFTSARLDDAALALVRGDLKTVTSSVLSAGEATWWALRYHTLYTAAYLVLTLVVMSLAGGAICRSAALQFARDERSGLVESVRYSSRRFGSFLTGPIWAVGVAALLAALIAILGLAGNLPWGIGPIVFGVLSPIAAFLAFLATIFIFGLVAGGCLMFPAVAYEGSDGMDSMGRAFGYLYMRPWRLGFYAVVAFAYGIICYLFVRLFAFIVLLLARSCMTAGLWAWSQYASTPDNRAVRLGDVIWPAPTFDTLFGTLPEAASGSEKIGAILIMIPHAVVAGLVAAFVLSFFFCACSIIYALLRKHVDGEDFSRIFTQIETSRIAGIDDERDVADKQ